MRTPSERPDFDQTLKRLLLRGRDGFLALIAPGLTWRAELSPELPAVTRRADIVWLVEDSDGQRWLLHIELQTKADSDMGERLAEYAIRLWRRERLPTRSLVVFLRPAATVPRSPFVIVAQGRESLRYEFDVLRLWEVPQERVLDTGLHELWPLASLMAGVTAETTADVAERIATAPVPPAERDELAQALIVLSGMRVPRAELRDALRRRMMLSDIWEESSGAAVLEDLARERGMGKVLRIVLESRFGTLDDDIVTALRGSDEAALETVGRHVTTDTLEQIRTLLGLG